MAKYWWGKIGMKDELFDMNGMMVFVVLCGVVLGALLLAHGPEGAVKKEFPGAQDFKGLALATTCMMFVMYLLLGNQIGIKFTEGTGDTFNKQKQLATEVANRGVYNNMEHIIQFVVMVWLHAFFVNPSTSAVLMWAFVVCRYFYPILNGMYGQFNLGCELTQQLHYAMIYYLFVAVWWKVHCDDHDDDFHTFLTNMKQPAVLIVVGILCNFLCLAGYLLIGKIGTTVILNGSKKAADGFYGPLPAK